MDNTTANPLWEERPCQYGHRIIWYSADTHLQVPPKGHTCQCGKLIADGKGGYENAGSEGCP